MKKTKDKWASLKFCRIDGGYTDNDGKVQPGDRFKDYLCAICQTSWQEQHTEDYPEDQSIFFYFDKDDRKKIAKAIRTGDCRGMGSDFVITKIRMGG